MSAKGIGQPVRRKEDMRLLTGAGCFSDDVDLPRQTRAHVLRSVHAHARIKGIDTTRAQGGEGRGRGTHRRRSQGRRHQADPARRLHHRADRGAAETARRGAGQPQRAVLPDAVRSACGRQGAPCRRGGGAGDRGDAGDRQGRGRAGRDRLRVAAGGHRDRAGGGERLAAAVGWRAVQHFSRRRGGRCRRDRQGVRRSRPCGAARHLGPARHRRADGGAHRRRALRQGERPLFPARGLRRRGAAEERMRRHPRRPARQGAGGRARHWRKFRHQKFDLPGIPAGAVGVEARRPAGEMGVRAQRSLPQRLSGPRPCRQGRACGRRARENSWRCAARI